MRGLVSATEPKIICETERLVLRELSEGDPDDVTFIRALVNDPGWLRYIGDRNVHDDESGRAYLAKIAAAYAEHGFGFWAVCPRGTGSPVGMCGLIKRPTLPEPDLGFAFLPRRPRSGAGDRGGAGPASRTLATCSR